MQLQPFASPAAVRASHISHRHTWLLGAAILFCGTVHAAKFSDLKVVQAAAQPGTWTMNTTGNGPDGKTMPAQKRTVCATRDEVLQSLNAPALGNATTGAEDKSCPTVLTTDTPVLGVASMSCPAQSLAIAGQKVSLPAMSVTTEFKKVADNHWTVTTGNRVTDITYQGSASASCVGKR